MKRKIELLIDTANLDEIKEAVSLGIFTGITTNPVILAKDTKDYKAQAKKILAVIPKNWEISFEVKATDTKDMIRQAKILSSWDKRIRVKLPVTEEGLKATGELIEKIPLNMTIVESAGQAMMLQALASKYKPKDIFLSVFCGHLNRAGYDWKNVIETIAGVDWPGRILAASIKNPFDISEAIRSGADLITAPLEIYKMALGSRLVRDNVEKFNTPFDDKNFKIK